MPRPTTPGSLGSDDAFSGSSRHIVTLRSMDSGRERDGTAASGQSCATIGNGGSGNSDVGNTPLSMEPTRGVAGGETLFASGSSNGQSSVPSRGLLMLEERGGEDWIDADDAAFGPCDSDRCRACLDECPIWMARPAKWLDDGISSSTDGSTVRTARGACVRAGGSGGDACSRVVSEPSIHVGGGPSKRLGDAFRQGVGGTHASAGAGPSVAGIGAPTPLAASRRERRTPCDTGASVAESGEVVIPENGDGPTITRPAQEERVAIPLHARRTGRAEKGTVGVTHVLCKHPGRRGALYHVSFRGGGWCVGRRAKPCACRACGLRVTPFHGRWRVRRRRGIWPCAELQRRRTPEKYRMKHSLHGTITPM